MVPKMHKDKYPQGRPIVNGIQSVWGKNGSVFGFLFTTIGTENEGILEGHKASYSTVGRN